MESVVRVKKSLRTPIRKLTSCVSGAKGRRLCAKHRRKRSRGTGSRGGCSMLGKTPPLRTAPPKDPPVICPYQIELEKTRQLREAMNAQKNAERAAMRAHFRRKHRLSESPKDTKHLRSVGGKVSLPHELSKMIQQDTKTKDDSFNLLRAFRGLSFNTAALTGRKASRTPTPMLTNRDSCRVM
ncbi:complexin-3-like [Leuresthes tenuis]|uniref:complexin-3-like n=1 Tax=Leuresthes tenuis TaxID=355514 RepID=UPI003B501C83